MSDQTGCTKVAGSYKVAGIKVFGRTPTAW